LTTVPALIELIDVRKRYGGNGKPEVEVLRGLSLRIDAGEFVAIVGASGSGKSTLMHILGCLDRPSAGRYLLNGRDVAELDADDLAWLRREAFGFVFQGYHLIASDSARENVEVPAIYAGVPDAERGARAASLLERLGMGDKQDNRPHQLSGGQQQRVSIARALMNGGSIILADEPTGALDSRVGAEVMRLLRELAQAGHTVILITHDHGVASQASRTIEIMDGRIVADRATKARNAEPALAAPVVCATGVRQPHASLWADLQEAARTAWRPEPGPHRPDPAGRHHRRRIRHRDARHRRGRAPARGRADGHHGYHRHVPGQYATIQRRPDRHHHARRPGGAGRPAPDQSRDARHRRSDTGATGQRREAHLCLRGRRGHAAHPPLATGAGPVLHRCGRSRPGATGRAGPQGRPSFLS